MEDSSSVKSNDSVATNEEYEIVQSCSSSAVTPREPQLNIANNGDIDDLKQSLCEVLTEEKSMEPLVVREKRVIKDLPVTESVKKVGASQFYSTQPAHEPINQAMQEKTDPMKDESPSQSFQDEGTEFSGVAYLGAAAINAPKSEAEIHRNMAILNREQAPDQPIRVILRVPSCSSGCVVLHEATTQQEMASYEVHRILFYAHGTQGSPEAACFAFTWSHGQTQESAIFQCHVFRCDIPEAVGQVSACFAKAFQRAPRPVIPGCVISTVGDVRPPINSPVSAPTEVFTFEVNMEIKEEDGRGGFSTVPKDRSQFKLRAHVEKQLCLTVQQVSSDKQRALVVERCFGVLVSPGRNVKHGDMQLLEMISMGSGSTESIYIISGHWDPADPAFEPLNIVEEPSSGSRTYITVAMDLVVRGIQEPVRFLIETPVRIFPRHERFWYFTRRPLVQQFYLNLRELFSPDPSEPLFEVINIETSGELDRSRVNLTLNLANLIRSPSFASLEALSPKEEDISDSDEPMLSGTGEVSKDCSEAQLESWAEILARWSAAGARPKQLAALVRQGVPEPLRGEVWQRLAGCAEDTPVMDNYRLLIAKESTCEAVIQRDISRTFPAHDFFKQAGGLGQDSLFRLSKAYAVHDEEVGYCQGLSFLAAALLLHMPEEQAFCVLVKLMFDYGLRDLFKDGFENLYMRLYQLNRLMEEQLPDLWQHFSDKGVEAHMFGSQWFLTLFTAKFPLYFVFHILDVFLLQGIDTLFQVALALLMMSKRDLLMLDFEGILKYFRVTLPKRCRSQEVARGLMRAACAVKVKRLRKYESEFLALKAAQESAEQCTSELERLRTELQRAEEDKKRLEEEVTQVKDMIKREVQKSTTENSRNAAIIADYKQICSQLSTRLEEEMAAAKQREAELKNRMASCSQCCTGPQPPATPTSPGGWIDPLSENHNDPRLSQAQQRVRELELELAQTKLAHVEAECRNQDLTHQLNAVSTELQASRGSWLHKTLTSIKEVTKKEPISPSTLLPGRRDSLPRDGVSRESLSRDAA